MKNNFLTIFLVATALLLPIEATAQSDGGKKKINKAKTERTTPVKKSTNQSKKSKQKPTTGTIAGHEWIDLGLPSGTKWATKNIGAYNINDKGDRYCWGEISIGDEYAQVINHFSKDIGGNPEFDVATAEYGSKWRMPSKMDFMELMNECEIEWITLDGCQGMKFTGPNGNFIFLPEDEKIQEYHYGRYWTSTPSGNDNAFQFTVFRGADIPFKPFCNIDSSSKGYHVYVRPIIKNE